MQKRFLRRSLQTYESAHQKCCGSAIPWLYDTQHHSGHRVSSFCLFFCLLPSLNVPIRFSRVTPLISYTQAAFLTKIKSASKFWKRRSYGDNVLADRILQVI